MKYLSAFLGTFSSSLASDSRSGLYVGKFAIYLGEWVSGTGISKDQW